MAEKGAILIVLGPRVQGVGFRGEMKSMADKLALVGEVCNCSDSRVRAEVEGEKDKIEQLREWAKTGPESAEVEQVLCFWRPFKGKFTEFQVK